MHKGQQHRLRQRAAARAQREDLLGALGIVAHELERRGCRLRRERGEERVLKLLGLVRRQLGMRRLLVLVLLVLLVLLVWLLVQGLVLLVLALVHLRHCRRLRDGLRDGWRDDRQRSRV